MALSTSNIEPCGRKKQTLVIARHSRRRQHLTDPNHCTSEAHEGFESGDGFLAVQSDSAEAFEFVEETFGEMALLLEHPFYWPAFSAARISLNVRHRA